ncbi:MAG: hypothetical protein HYR76_04285 [Ignavibacteria bacterium]|nr:hypothetical protein [Ignavibacteria bacterium]
MRDTNNGTVPFWISFTGVTDHTVTQAQRSATSLDGDNVEDSNRDST